MGTGERRLHLLEKIVAICALAGVLFVSVGFARAGDGLKLRSSVALVQDADSGETLYEKNSETVLPIASITKLMTAIVVLERGLDLEEPRRKLPNKSLPISAPSLTKFTPDCPARASPLSPLPPIPRAGRKSNKSAAPTRWSPTS
jgi:hypothetical protein